MSLVLRDGRAVEARPFRRPTTPDERRRARRLAALRMRTAGEPVQAIADFLGVSRQTIYNWLRGIPPEAATMAAFN